MWGRKFGVWGLGLRAVNLGTQGVVKRGLES